jgi:hypothetical protein
MSYHGLGIDQPGVRFSLQSLGQVTLEQVFPRVFGFLKPVIIPSYLLHPLSCVKSLTRQHVITSQSFNLISSCLTWHVNGYRVRK